MECRTSAQRKFKLKSQVRFQTENALLNYHIPHYYIHLEITQLDRGFFFFLCVCVCVCVCVLFVFFFVLFFFVRAKFWEPKLQNLPNNCFLCISYSCNFIAYLKQASKSDLWLLLLFFGFLSHWLGNTNDLEQRILLIVN